MKKAGHGQLPLQIVALLTALVASPAWAQTQAPRTNPRSPDTSAQVLRRENPSPPLRMEQDCPPPAMAEVSPTDSSRQFELGISFSLKKPPQAPQLYSRYTCPRPNSLRR